MTSYCSLKYHPQLEPDVVAFEAVFHIMEPEIMAQIDPAIRKEHLSIMEIALDVEKIAQGLNRVGSKRS